MAKSTSEKPFVSIPFPEEIQRPILRHQQNIELLSEALRASESMQSLRLSHQQAMESFAILQPGPVPARELLVGSVSVLCGDELVDGINIKSAAITLHHDVCTQKAETGMSESGNCSLKIAVDYRHMAAIDKVLTHLIACAEKIKASA